MTPEERFQRIEENLDIATGLIVKTDERLDRISSRLDRVSDRLDRISDRLDRAVRLAVHEARTERRKRREVEQGVQELRETLKAFIDSLRKGGNGQG